jgi:hypothetical protein
MFGLGGIFVEVFKDVSVSGCALDNIAAEKLITNEGGDNSWGCARGENQGLMRLKKTIMRLDSQLAVECPQIRELDVNPLIVLDDGKGVFVADTKIMYNIA